MADDSTGSGFADLLRELKNRSGHSYGTLAKRLHMSTSTLHRYCNGDAVPADYAPVERLARLCRAAPEELVELHRRWVLADAGRGRREPAPVQETATEPVAVAVAATGPVADEAPEAVPVQELQELVPPVSDIPGPAPADGPRSRLRTRRRTRTVLLAALTVTALLGTAALALTLPSGGAEADGKGAGPGAAAGAGSASVQQHTPTAGAPHATGPARGASASPSGASSAGAPPDGGPGASHPATGGADTGSAPLAVTTHPYSWTDPCSQHYLIDRAPSDVSPPPLEQDAPAWVAVHKAVSAGEQYVTLTVQGTGGNTVVLEGLSVRVAGRRAPLAWNDYAMGYPGVGCGGGVPTRSFTVALDALRPQVVPESGHQDFPFKVSRTDPEVLYVTADASAYDVSWYLELAWSSGGRHGTLLIGDEGRPFRTSGDNGRPAYAFPLGGDAWKPAAGAN